jgi:hypothetical protein
VQPPKTFTLTEEELQSKYNERLSKERRRLERAVRAELERDFYKNQVEQSRQQAQPQKSAEGRPREEDFQGRPYHEFTEALADWKAEQKLSAFRKEIEEHGRASQSEAAKKQAVEKLYKGADKYPDFDEVIRQGAYISEPMGHAITAVSNASDVAYYLCNNHDEAQQIFSLPPIEQVWAIKDLSSKLSATPVPKPVPAPITPNKGTAPVEVRLEDADFDDFVKIRHKQLVARGKRRR